MDGKARGGAAAVAASYGVGSVFEPSVGGTFGPHQGAFVRGTFYLLSGMAKPALLLGVPLFFVDGVRAGVSGGAGLQLDFSRLLGGFVQAGVEWYPAPPSGYEKVQFVPTVGVQGRL